MKGTAQRERRGPLSIFSMETASPLNLFPTEFVLGRPCAARCRTEILSVHTGKIWRAVETPVEGNLSDRHVIERGIFQR